MDQNIDPEGHRVDDIDSILPTHFTNDFLDSIGSIQNEMTDLQFQNANLEAASESGQKGQLYFTQSTVRTQRIFEIKNLDVCQDF